MEGLALARGRRVWPSAPHAPPRRRSAPTPRRSRCRSCPTQAYANLRRSRARYPGVYTADGGFYDAVNPRPARRPPAAGAGPVDDHGRDRRRAQRRRRCSATSPATRCPGRPGSTYRWSGCRSTNGLATDPRRRPLPARVLAELPLEPRPVQAGARRPAPGGGCSSTGSSSSSGGSSWSRPRDSQAASAATAMPAAVRPGRRAPDDG